jgi:hypothetical protein
MTVRKRADAERSTLALFMLALCAFVLFTGAPVFAA